MWNSRLSKSQVAAAVLPRVWKLLGQPRCSCACSQGVLAAASVPLLHPWVSHRHYLTVSVETFTWREGKA